MANLLNDQVKDQIKSHLTQMVNPVTMVLFTQGNEESCMYCDETASLLQEVSGLNDKLSVEIKDLEKDNDLATQYGVTLTPSFVMLDSEGNYTGVKFNGIPAGHEINSFLSGILGMSGADPGFDAKTLERIKKINKPVNIKVFVTLSCPHCPGAVAKAHQLAMLNEHVQGEMIEANTFQELSTKYNVSGVPKIVINDSIELLGDQPMEEFLNRIESL